MEKEIITYIENLIKEFEFKKLIYDGQVFNDEIEVFIDNSIHCNTEVSYWKENKKILIKFNIDKINKNILQYGFKKNSYFKYLILHELSHIWLIKEDCKNRNETQSLLIQMFDYSKIIGDMFSKYSVLEPILTEVLCDAMVIDMLNNWSMNTTIISRDVYFDIKDIISTTMIPYYDNNIITIIKGERNKE